ncbi:MAG: hypothetical protein RR704_16235 [Stenotrophomonas sp.]
MSWKAWCCGTALLLASLPVLARGPHVDLIDFPSNEASWDRFFDLEGALMKGFDHLCADTWCEGDYSNYQVLQVRCAVLVPRGTVQRCSWVVVASELGIDPRTGQVRVDNGRWVCHAGVRPGVPVDAFFTALQAPDGLFEPLPGTGTSLFDALPGCLRGPGQQGRAA